MDHSHGRRGERKGQAVEKKPTGVAERRADRAAGREPLDARTGRSSDQSPSAGSSSQRHGVQAPRRER